MKKTTLSRIFIIFVFCELIGSFILPQPPVIKNENRMRVQFPSFSAVGGFTNTKEYFSQIDKFAADNLPLRKQFLKIHHFLIKYSNAQTNIEKAFEGKDNWLFLGNSYNRNIEKLEGKLTPDAKRSTLLANIIDVAHAFQEKGVKVAFLLGPRKESVYPEYLPAIIRPSAERFVLPFMEELKRNAIPVAEPTEALKAEKNKIPVYWKTDTHWNLVGGSIAFEEVMKTLGIQGCPSYEFRQEENFDGDLINIGDFEKPDKNLGDNYSVQWKDPVELSEKIITEEDIPSTAATRIISNPHAPHKKSIWLLGDSFREGLAPFISHCFARTNVYHFDYNSKEKLLKLYEQAQEKPEYLVIVITERSF